MDQYEVFAALKTDYETGASLKTELQSGTWPPLGQDVKN